MDAVGAARSTRVDPKNSSENLRGQVQTGRIGVGCFPLLFAALTGRPNQGVTATASPV